MTVIPTRRERLRAATLTEIKQTARRLLVDEGPAAVSLRAIAREMGMTAPALYRYVPSHEALLDALCTDLKDELVTELLRARDALPDRPIGPRMRASCRAFRGWAIRHPAEFTLMFASARGTGPTASVEAPAGAECVDYSADMTQRFGGVFLDMIVTQWRAEPFPVPEPDFFPEQLRAQLERFVAVLGIDVPIGVAYVFVSGWVRLYGLVALEVFGHLDFALSDVEPLFETEMNLLAAALGLTFEE